MRNKQKNKILIFRLLIILNIFFLSFCSKPPKVEPGKYVNYKYNFTIEFPKDWVIGEKIPGDNLHLIWPASLPEKYHDLVLSIYKSYTLLDEAPEEWIFLVNILYPVMTTKVDFVILSKKNIILNDGTSAIKAVISWVPKKEKDDKGMILEKGITCLLAMDKNNKRIIFHSTGTQNIPFANFEKIVDSFRFNTDIPR